ncbi:MAG TPA: hypothetical protein PK264_21285, partial [Hyphomicrobiaceae bacterium]|nr:hypothetical protein [Hyphomicrobiaceae bacterium]
AGATAGAIVALVVGAFVGVRWYGLVVPYSELVRILLATAVMVGALWFAPMKVGTFGLLAEVAAGAAIYGVAIMALMPRVLDRVIGLLRSGRRSAS